MKLKSLKAKGKSDGRTEKGIKEALGKEDSKRLSEGDGKGVPVVSKTTVATPSQGLVPTSTYKPWKYPFKEFNPVQSSVFPYIQQDNNIVISAATSAGKTIAAELVMDYVLRGRQKVAYLSPLKSLTQEKYADWQKRFANRKIVILTGDYVLSRQKQKDLEVADIIVMTSEMADSRTRRFHSEKNYWLNMVGLLIVDEAHIISTDRGHAVEAGLMRFTKLNPKARVILLSATMPNVKELGDWLEKMNRKKSIVLQSTWRPVQLQINFLEYAVSANSWGRENYQASQYAKRTLAVQTVMSKPKEKFLVFCHDKGTMRAVADMLYKAGEKSVKIHNADLDLPSRMDVEETFADRGNKGLRVLVSTSTLAWGRNLPARNVVIVGIHRGIQEVDQLDIIQMAGRAGRYGIDDAGFVFLLIPKGSTPIWDHNMKNPRPIKSTLLRDPILEFHVLAEIDTKAIKLANEISTWFSRSLAAQQGGKIDFQAATRLAAHLASIQMLYGESLVYGKQLSLTGLGRVSAWLYFAPSDIYGWFLNFCRVFDKCAPSGRKVDDLELAWAIGNVPTNDLGYISKEIPQDDLWSYQDQLTRGGLAANNTLPSVMAIHHLLKGSDPEVGIIRTLQRGAAYDIERINQALNLIDSMHAKWKQKHLWDTLALRIKYGVPEELTGLVKIPKVGKARAMQLSEKGLKKPEDLLTPKGRAIVNKLFNQVLAREILDGVKMIIDKGE